MIATLRPAMSDGVGVLLVVHVGHLVCLSRFRTLARCGLGACDRAWAARPGRCAAAPRSRRGAAAPRSRRPCPGAPSRRSVSASWPTARIRPSNTCTSSMTWPRISGGADTVASSSSRSTDSPRVELGDLHHVDQLVELLDHLLERRRLDVDDDRDPAEALVLGGRDGQREDVEAAPGEQPGDAGEHAGLVLDEHRQDVVLDSRPSLIGRPPRRATGTTTISSLRRAGGHHREHLLAAVGAELDDDRTVVDLVRLLDGGLHLFGRLDPHADAAHRLGPHLVVGQVGRQVHLGVALLVEHLLPLADHAEVGVVEDRDLDRDALGRRGHELLRGHLEAAVAVDGPHHAVGPADLGADRRRHREAHRAEAARVHPRVRVVELPVLRSSTSGAGRRPTRRCSRRACCRAAARARTAA